MNLIRTQGDSSLPLILFTIAVILLGCFRYRYLDMALERDEGEFAYGGQLLLQGDLPYVSLYSMKAPGIYAVYAIIETLFGETARGIHWGLLCANLASTGIVYLIGVRLFDSWTGLIASVVFSVLTFSPVVHGMQAQAEHFVLLPALIGALLLTDDHKSGWRCLLAGLAFGLALLIKQPAIMFCLFGFAYLILYERQGWRNNFWQRGKRIALFGVGVSLPVVAACLFFFLLDAWSPFIYWTFTYPRWYATQVTLSDGLRSLSDHMKAQLQFTHGIWIAAALGITLLAFVKRYRGKRLWTAAWCLASFLAVTPGLWFRPHYFVLMAPAIALLAAIGLRAIYLGSASLGRVASIVALLVPLVAIGWPIWNVARYMLSGSPDEIMGALYTEFFVESKEIGTYLADNVGIDERFGVLGSEPQLFFYSRRRSVTPYVYMYPLFEDQPDAERMRQEMKRDIERTRPKYLVVNVDSRSWGLRNVTQSEFWKWMQAYVPAHYHLVARFERFDDRPTLATWNAEDVTTMRSDSLRQLFVLRRNAGDE